MRSFLSAIALFLVAPMLVVHADGPKDFSLASVTDDSTFELSKNEGKYVALHFLLKTECPLCQRHTLEYAKLAEKDPSVVHIFIKPDEVEEIRKWTKHLDAKALKKLPKIYRDPNAELAKQYAIPDGYSFHGQRVRYPALVLLDTKGQEVFRYVGKSNSDRYSVNDFKTKLASLQESK